jgi:hypothetical protein
MYCPKCGSPNLDVKRSTGFESFMVVVTGGKRKFVCRRCSSTFRALDPAEIRARAKAEAEEDDAHS